MNVLDPDLVINELLSILTQYEINTLSVNKNFAKTTNKHWRNMAMNEFGLGEVEGFNRWQELYTLFKKNRIIAEGLLSELTDNDLDVAKVILDQYANQDPDFDDVHLYAAARNVAYNNQSQLEELIKSYIQEENEYD